MRTLEPERYPRFATGLRIFGPDGRPVADFDGNVRRSLGQGWAAFSAAVPAGPYVIRGGRPGVRVRHQPLFICSGWETHVFLTATSAPDLRTLSLAMVPRGSGFRARDETILAADAVLETLQRAKGIRGVVSRQQLQALLSGKIENPWLGLLVLVALEHAAEGGTGEESEHDRAVELRQRFAHVRDFVADAIGDHPDWRALQLQIDAPAASLFHSPPLLRACLQRVRSHAVHWAETVPMGSLTDRVLDGVHCDSPWTAWQSLQPTDRAAGAHGHSVLVPRSAMVGWSSAASKAPLYRVESQHAAAATPQVVEPRVAPLLDVGFSLVTGYRFDDLPKRFEFDARQRIADLVQRVDPVSVSRALGTPLSHVQRWLEQFEATDFKERPGLSRRPSVDSASSDEQLLHLALFVSDRVPTGQRDSAGTAVSDLGQSLEDIVSIIRVEADRLLAWLDRTAEVPGNVDREAVRADAAGLHACADRLLGRALFAVLTD
ncbi:MAG TPA: hypothetical protein VK399_13380, partial [Longimicrobiaceae bacterium]|nr:hypothetical protein [Longimicrobiaceae bacterium]